MVQSILKSKYELKQLLSEDILSYSYLGKTHYSNVPVCVWKYKKDYLNSALVERLIRLCEQLICLKDPHVLTLLDYHYDGKHFYAVYEYVEGMIPLESYLEEDSIWDLGQLWKFSTQLLSALVHLESSKLCCGALNLTAIYVTSDKQIKLTKVALSIEVLRHAWSQFDVVEDCLFYPPEFVQHQRYFVSSDIYSFGVLLYLFFSRKWPYKATLNIQALKKVLLEGPRPFHRVSSRLPSRLDDVVKLCLKVDPQKRFSSFSELIHCYKGDMSFRFVGRKAISRSIQEDLQLSLDISKKKRVYTWLRYSISISIIFVCFVVSYVLYMDYLTAIPERVVPDVVGYPQEEAEQFLEDHQLNSLVVGARIHSHYDRGLIIETKPPPGRAVKQNRTIRLFVSKGRGRVLVPDLVGRAKEEVDTLLAEHGFLIDIEDEVYSVHYPKGAVVSQRPVPSSYVAPSENVRLVLSKGVPVELDVKKARSSFFRSKSHLRLVRISFFLLEDWSSQEVGIFFIHKGQKEKLFFDVLQSGQRKDMDFELDVDGRLDVYFGDDLVVSKRIKDNDPL